MTKNTLLTNIFSNLDTMSPEHFIDWIKQNRKVLLWDERKQIIDSANQQNQIRTMGGKPAYENGLQYFENVFNFNKGLTDIDKVILAFKLKAKLSENKIPIVNMLMDLNLSQDDIDNQEYSFITDIINNTSERKVKLVHEEFIDFMFQKLYIKKIEENVTTLNDAVTQIISDAVKHDSHLFPKQAWNEFISKFPLQEWFNNLKA